MCFRKEQIELLTELYNISEQNQLGMGMAIKIKFAIVAGMFDYNLKISEAMKPDHWEMCVPAVKELLEMITNAGDDLITGENISEDTEQFEEAPYKVIQVAGAYRLSLLKLK